MPATLLLADDSVTIQRVIEMTFAEEDVRVVTVGDGREAIERIAADPPDIVLADTNMPEKDGYEVSAFVKAESARSGIPVVLLTGAFEPVDDERAREVGCDAVLVKPFEPTAVLNRVRELLGVPADAGPTAPGAAGAAAPAGNAAAAGRGGRGERGRGGGAERGAGVRGLRRLARGPGLGRPGGGRRPAGGFGCGGSRAAGCFVRRLPDAAAPAAVAPSAAPDAAAVPAAVAPSAASDAAASAAGASPAAPGSGPPPAPDAEPGASPAAHDEEAGDAPAEEAGDAAPPAPALPAVEAPAPPSLAAAFVSLLAAEQGDLDRARAAYPWPRQAAPPDEDDLVERVAERVVERLSDDITGELVSEVVARVAERLVRDQIGRIEPA